MLEQWQARDWKLLKGRRRRSVEGGGLRRGGEKSGVWDLGVRDRAGRGSEGDIERVSGVWLWTPSPCG